MTETIVIKIGGQASNQLPSDFFVKVHQWQQEGKKILVIHGGGPQINQWAHQLGLSTHKEQGIRVTNRTTLEVTQAVLLGVVQPALCQQFSQHQLPVVGLNTRDNQLLVGHYLDQKKYGEVGQLTGVNTTWLQKVLEDYVVVLAPLVQTDDGQMLNVNADQAAVAITTQLSATQLIFLTDVPGILKMNQVVPQLDQAGVNDLVKHQQVKAGMLPKIEAALSAVRGGARRVMITNGLSNPGTILASDKS